MDYVDQHAGLLVGRSGEMERPVTYGFPHRSLQEYLAGCHIIGQRDLVREFYAHAGVNIGAFTQVRSRVFPDPNTDHGTFAT